MRGTPLLVRVGGMLIPTVLATMVMLEHELLPAVLVQLAATAAPQPRLPAPASKLQRHALPGRRGANTKPRPVRKGYQQLQLAARGTQPARREQHESSRITPDEAHASESEAVGGRVGGWLRGRREFGLHVTLYNGTADATVRRAPPQAR